MLCSILRRLVLASGLASPLILATNVAIGSPAKGVWQAAEDDAQVEIYDCGVKLCGRLLTSNELRAHPDLKDVNNTNTDQRERLVKGLVILWGFSGGPGSWSGGNLYRPQQGRSYSGNLELVGNDKLKVTGCAMGALCQTQVWTRLK